MWKSNKAFLIIGGIALIIGICGIHCEFWYPFSICIGFGAGIIAGSSLGWIMWGI